MKTGNLLVATVIPSATKCEFHMHMDVLSDVVRSLINDENFSL
jgi:hypothetical protein